MPRVTDTRQRMIRTASRLLRRQGYAATGWRQVVADSETPWGSQAHHFPGGKEQLAVEALTASGAAYERLLTRAFTAHPADTITAWGALAGAELEASGWADGCPIATVTLETAHTSPALAQVCGAALTSWREIIAESLVRHGLAPADAVPLATLILAAIEGALLLARATRDVTPLHDVAQQLSDVVRNRIG
ncbi:TetR/AcrR family transcriptional regulator [Antrihabitans sp. NCIMB 15449]|uniref:TetR/AcrR family transcriptional regulator n=2 Tax=Antrihabitans TaxID=2799491 RepID=A0A934NMW8_9NOCA|nr:TetR family transcriptional regulator C-terminal domain-containing protein [Antrihabitans stalagmiti]MBJ8338173.1 TetR/AcrR family transcriptional regulator [Antrihabitans stalagmiti]